MFDELEKYKQNDHFFFKKTHLLRDVCNAPTTQSGVYIVYALAKGRIDLIYIGRSGEKLANGNIKNRVTGLGGIKDDIVNGLHFNGKPRRISWPAQMIKQDIEALDIYWWVTYDDDSKDCPREIEKTILTKYFELYGQLPRWNKIL
jgi:hypothetical protein